jgi:hypothetical protein
MQEPLVLNAGGLNRKGCLLEEYRLGILESAAGRATRGSLLDNGSKIELSNRPKVREGVSKFHGIMYMQACHNSIRQYRC